MYGTQVNSTKQSTPAVGLPKSSSARDSKKMLPVIPLNVVQKLLLVTKLAQSYWKKRKQIAALFLIWSDAKIYKLHNKSTQVNSTKQSTRTVGLSTSSIGWDFKKHCPQFFFFFKKFSKVAPKKEKNCYSLFIWFDSKMYKLHNKSKISKHFFVLVLFFCASSVTK